MKTLKEIREEYILKALEKTDWNLSKASKLLKVSEAALRREIHKKMKTILKAGKEIHKDDGEKKFQ